MTDDRKTLAGLTENDSVGVLEQARPEADDAAVAALMAEYLSWAIRRLEEEYGLTESPTDLGRIRDSLRAFRPPTGSLIVIRGDGELVGVGALRTLQPGIVEVKRMYVAPSWRARGLGAELLDRLLAEAGESLSAKRVRLDTCRFMTQAQRLYSSRGFVEREPYEGTEIPPQLQAYWRFFEKEL